MQPDQDAIITDDAHPHCTHTIKCVGEEDGNMNWKSGIFLAALAAVPMLVGGAPPSSAEQAAAPMVGRVKIATNYVRADGCHDASQTFTTQVPASDRLDRSYHGVLDGIEIVETAANGTHAIRNVTWLNGNTISYQLYAKGAGHWVDPPKVFGTRIGGGYCHGAAGASEGVEVYARYRQ
jgi:hypothetical protein